MVTKRAYSERLSAFVKARLDEWQAWVDGCESLHWQWVDGYSDLVIKVDPLLDTYLGDHVESGNPSLRSVEEFPAEHLPGFMLPRFAISTAEETLATAAGHILQHDPARVAQQIKAMRSVLALYETFAIAWDRFPCEANVLSTAIEALANTWSDHPDFDPDWVWEDD